MANLEIHFGGGPGAAAGALRGLLAERIDAVPPGGAIDVVTYYFRDRSLAKNLVRARERGVRVLVALEARPRTPGANDAVAAILSRGLGAGFRSVAHRRLPPLPRPRLHEKLYLFSDPPAALVGSFNPSSDTPEQQPAVIEAIGDHDAGYNSLVELRSPDLVRGLAEHARRIHAGRHNPTERFGAGARPLHSGTTTVHFLPRARPDPMLALFDALRAGDRARIAASHLSGLRFPRALVRAARRGVRVELVSHASERRFPARAEAGLRTAGVRVRRVGSAVSAPMHEKFALLEGRGGPVVVFGSLNLNEQSRLLNHELGVVSGEISLIEGYGRRFEQLQRAQ